jgi:hypothetical protein
MLQRLIEPLLAARVQADLVAVGGKVLSDAVPHEAGADYRDAADVTCLHASPEFLEWLIGGCVGRFYGGALGDRAVRDVLRDRGLQRPC